MTKKLVGLLLVALATACGGQADELEPAGSEQADIVLGDSVNPTHANNVGMVAVYHKHTPASGPTYWWPRPCSGTVIAYRSGKAAVLTARHCVTVNGSKMGALPSVASTWIKVSPGNQPGPVPSGGNPPSSAVAASSVVAMSPVNEDDYSKDVAIVWVTAPWSGLMATTKGIYMANPTNLAGVSATAYGYGLNVENFGCQGNGNVTTGAGTLRTAVFSIASGTRAGTALSGTYSHPNTNSLGQKIICGDSGGPDLGNVAPDMFLPHVFGVHGGANAVESVNGAPGPWVSQIIGGLALSPMSSGGSNLRRRSDGILLLEPYPSVTNFQYWPGSKEIVSYDTGPRRCLAWVDEVNSMALDPCNSSGPQQWEVIDRGYIRNTSLNLCIKHKTTGWVEVASCPATGASQADRARFTWVWRARP